MDSTNFVFVNINLTFSILAGWAPTAPPARSPGNTRAQSLDINGIRIVTDKQTFEKECEVCLELGYEGSSV